jgi:16S rRNA (guanine966-N2)-methyltransferase
VRVIGGTARGRALKAPSSSIVRPTSGRAREAIFDALASITSLDGATVLDLFCGSGALGIEALSRGALSATFVDNDRDALFVAEKNLLSTGLAQPGTGATARLFRRDAITYLANSGRFDVAFIDPPYKYEGWAKIFRHLNAEIAVCESNGSIEPEGSYELYRAYRYGGTLVHIVQRSPDSEAASPP